MSDTPPAELVADKYRLTRLLGRGGMGSVWEGVHVSLGTRVAVKFIETEHADSAEARTRFQNEARAAAKLASKHVVKVFDHGVTPDGRPYMVMEFLAGEPLDQRLDRVGRLTLHEVTSIVQQVAKALTRAHDAGIVHRDLKPENVFLVREEDEVNDIVKVVDFGIAKFTDSSGGLSSSTKTGHVLGTPYYMSPEQARGLRAVDHRSDLWSVAVIAFKAVSGQMPFTGEAVGDLLVQICTAAPPALGSTIPGVPASFDGWVQRALAKEPAQRFQSATELADGLASIAGLPTSAPASSLSAAQTVAASNVVSSPAWPRPAEGVTAAPFTQNAIRPKKAAPLGIVVGAGAGALFLIVVVVVTLVSLSGGKSSAAGTVPEVVAPTLSQPAETGPVVAATVTPPASVDPPPPSASSEPDKPAPKISEKTPQKTGTKSGTKSGTKPPNPTTAGTKKPVDPLGY